MKEFCSPNCSVKSGRRNTVENFDLLPPFVDEPISPSVASAKFHTLPHRLASAKKEKKTPNPDEENQADLEPEIESPPRVPPHQNLANSSADSPR